MRPLRPALLAPLALLAACASEPTTFAPPAARDGSSSVDAVVSDDAARPTFDVTPVDRPPVDAAPLDDVLVYANTARDLYRLDPRTLTVSRVGAFAFADDGQNHEMTDVAVNAAGELWGISFNAIYRIDTATARCSLVSPLQGMYNGLTFVPAGVLSPSTEVLVAVASSGDYYVVNTSDGRVQRLGSYGGLASSGDLVSIATADTWAIVKQGGGDQLARVDLRSGRTTVVGPTGVDDLWGIGYWRGRLYAFSSNGEFVTLAPDTGRATVQMRTGQAWWGAGVTTIAPTAPP